MGCGKILDVNVWKSGTPGIPIIHDAARGTLIGASGAAPWLENTRYVANAE
jgi:hypothetical protein